MDLALDCDIVKVGVHELYHLGIVKWFVIIDPAHKAKVFEAFDHGLVLGFTPEEHFLMRHQIVLN